MNAIQTTVERVATEYRFRKPNEEDGADVWTLVKGTGILDLNSSYSYLMWCKYFRDTSVVVEKGGRIVGFISGFIKPAAPDVLFIWQVAVDESQRGKGLATRMLRHLLKRPVCENVHYLEATVSPSNRASQQLFTRFADKLDTACEIKDCFTEDHFPEEGHEDERSFHIGPFTTRRGVRVK
ncbi:MAG TPA: diaminobutyrate acetyltransferase [Bacillales bacterium]|nr:diaminobutyrate acetyltransferase [Bacillales bacterium]